MYDEEKIRTATLDAAATMVSATTAAQKAIDRLRNPDTPMWQWAGDSLIALQEIWEAFTPDYHQWRRDLGSALLEASMPQAAVASLLGVAERNLRVWVTQTPSTLPPTPADATLSPAARIDDARELIAGALEALCGWMAWGRQTLDFYGTEQGAGAQPPSVYLELAASARMTPICEVLIARVFAGLHAVGFSAAAIGRAVGISRTQVQWRIALAGEQRYALQAQ